MDADELYRPLRSLVALVLALVGSIVYAARPEPAVPYPDGFRSWQHVKSVVVGPEASGFRNRGGFHHFYANAVAIEGYRSGKFPNGSVIVDEGVYAQNGEDRQKGLLLEA